MSLVSIVTALANDALSLAGLPGGGALSEATKRILDRRLAAAREIWLDEVRLGERHLASIGQVDDVAAILYRYQRAAIEGTARLNLRLMAAVANGQAENVGFAADEFLAWADALAGLRREELILIAAMQRAETAPPNGLSESEGRLWPLTGKWPRVFDALIPAPFATSAAVLASAASAVRSGLVMPASGTMDEPVTFVTTPALSKLMALAPLEAVMVRDKAKVSR